MAGSNVEEFLFLAATVIIALMALPAVLGMLDMFGMGGCPSKSNYECIQDPSCDLVEGTSTYSNGLIKDAIEDGVGYLTGNSHPRDYQSVKCTEKMRESDKEHDCTQGKCSCHAIDPSLQCIDEEGRSNYGVCLTTTVLPENGGKLYRCKYEDFEWSDVSSGGCFDTGTEDLGMTCNQWCGSKLSMDCGGHHCPRTEEGMRAQDFGVNPQEIDPDITTVGMPCDLEPPKSAGGYNVRCSCEL